MITESEICAILRKHIIMGIDGSAWGVIDAAEAIAAQLVPLAGLDKIQRMIDINYVVTIFNLGTSPLVCVDSLQERKVSQGYESSLLAAIESAYAGMIEAME